MTEWRFRLVPADITRELCNAWAGSQWGRPFRLADTCSEISVHRGWVCCLTSPIRGRRVMVTSSTTASGACAPAAAESLFTDCFPCQRTADG